jgi:hypothetical protein
MPVLTDKQKQDAAYAALVKEAKKYNFSEEQMMFIVQLIDIIVSPTFTNFQFQLNQLKGNK